MGKPARATPVIALYRMPPAARRLASARSSFWLPIARAERANAVFDDACAESEWEGGQPGSGADGAVPSVVVLVSRVFTMRLASLVAHTTGGT